MPLKWTKADNNPCVDFIATYRGHTFTTTYFVHGNEYALDLQLPNTDHVLGRIGYYKTLGAARSQATRFTQRIDRSLRLKERATDGGSRQ